jgi:hypothetical protein
MNQQETIQQMRALKLSGMVAAYQNILSLPLDLQPPADQLLAQLLDAEHLERLNRKTLACVKAARFRYLPSKKFNIFRKEVWIKI